MTNYGSLAGPGLTFAGVDQGIDFTGAGDVYAPASGVVTRLVPSGSGWSGQGALLVYRVTEGPRAGQFIYVAEDFVARAGLRVGSAITQGDVLGTATGSGQAPGIEVGWANALGHALATLDRSNPHAPTAAGQDFHSFITGLPDSVAALAGGAGAAPSTLAAGLPTGCGGLLLMLAITGGVIAFGATAALQNGIGHWTITAYCLRGHTATGAPAGPGVVAVDPAVIPLGSRLWVDGYGNGRALDTGSAVRGRHVDVWIASCSRALRFTHYGNVRWWRR